jgi:hypothetical protein
LVTILTDISSIFWFGPHRCYEYRKYIAYDKSVNIMTTNHIKQHKSNSQNVTYINKAKQYTVFNIIYIVFLQL